MINDAPISFAPAVAHNPIGPCANTTTVSPIRMLAGFGAAESGRGDVGQEHDLLVAELVGNLRQIRLRVRHQEIFRLRAIDRVAETPAADRF